MISPSSFAHTGPYLRPKFNFGALLIRNHFLRPIKITLKCINTSSLSYQQPVSKDSSMDSTSGMKAARSLDILRLVTSLQSVNRALL